MSKKIDDCLAMARSKADPAEDIELLEDIDRIEAAIKENTEEFGDMVSAREAIQNGVLTAGQAHDDLLKRLRKLVRPSGYGSKNKLVTKSAADAARDRIRAKLRNLSANPMLDPELMQDGMTLAVFHIESGAREFVEFARRMVADMEGYDIKPFLRSWYESARHFPGIEAGEMTPYEDMDAAVETLDATLESGEVGNELQEGDTTEEPGVREDDRGSGLEQGAGVDTEVAGDRPEDGGQPGTPGDTGGVRPRDGDREAGTGGQIPESRTRPGRDADVGEGDRPVRQPERDPEPNEHVDDLESTATNYHITDPASLVSGSPKKRFAKNRLAIETYYDVIESGRDPTAEEKDALASYIGWGSFGQELFQGSWANPEYKDGWEDENNWLRDILGEEAWKSAQASIRNAHYTDPPTVNAIWGMIERMGFQGGRVLEPAMGIGNFFGMMPIGLEQHSQLAGIELDQMSADIAKMLYPVANISQKGYQESQTPDNFYDLVVGNWPFDSQGPADRRYNKISPSLHDYFFLKAMDQVRPGGLVVGISSRFSMDSVSRAVRMDLAKKAELVASFRLPSGAFKDYAGTSVVTDIIILKKRETPIADPSGENWMQAEKVEFGNKDRTANINQYYLENPDKVLGTHNFGHGTTYGREGLIVDRPDDLMEMLESLPDKVPEGVYAPRSTPDPINYITNNTADRNNAITVGEDNELYVVRGEYLAPLAEVVRYRVQDERETARREAQVRGLVSMRRQYGELMDSERAGLENTPAVRATLNAEYEAFVEAHGPIRDSLGLKYMEQARDPFHASMAALERDDGQGGWQKMPVLTRPTTRARKKLENPSVIDAYIMQRNTAAQINLGEIARMAKTTEAEAAKQLLSDNTMFALPGGGYEPKDVYLSGNVRRKLREAKDAKEQGESMDANISALEEVIPTDIPYFNIEANMGAQWVAPRHYESFIIESIANLPEDARFDVQVEWRRNRWVVNTSGDVNTSADATRIRDVRGYVETGQTNLDGSPVMIQDDQKTLSLKKLLEAALNNLTLKFSTKDSEGNTIQRVSLSIAANERVAAIREQFQDWLWRTPERKVSLEHDYNEILNANALPAYDGSFLSFDGMALERGDNEFNLREHQVNAVWRGIVQGSGLYAHEVGTGKTYTMAGIAVESRRLGLARKPLLLAHNANSATVAAEINDMYPGAKVLYVDNLKPDSIDITMQQIANDDWDAVVLPHSLIDRLSLTGETLMQLAQEEITALEDEIREAATEDGLDLAGFDLNDSESIKGMGRASPTAKELAKARLKIITTIQTQAQRATRPGAITFEELGVDMLLVDEAHIFKKPQVTTRMEMKGLQKQTSNRSLGLNFLTSYIKRENAGRGVHLFTGTPITNSLAEIYNMQRYVMESEMERDGVQAWDSWFNTFATGVSDIEYTAAGEYREIIALSGFVNVAELRRMISPYLDVVFAEEMPEFNPRATKAGKTMNDELTATERDELLNGFTEEPEGRPYKKVITDVAIMSPEQAAIQARLKQLSQEFERADGRTKREWMQTGDEHSPLLIDGVATRISLDARNEDLSLPEYEDSKANRAVKNVMKHYNEAPNTSQVIFTDKGYSDTKTVNKVRVPGFNVVKDLVEKLVAAGIPLNEIQVVKGGKGGTNSQKRAQIAKDVAAGKIRIVIGQTATLGTGVNMQDQLRAMHHLDAPWMPGELEQRNGRGHRQGNGWNTVMEYRYVTESIDGKRWQTLVRKSKFIFDFLHADSATRVIESDSLEDDGDSLGASLAEAVGDPRLMIRMKLKKDVDKLLRKERIHARGVVDAQSDLRANKQAIPELHESAVAYRKDHETYTAAMEDASEAQHIRNQEALVSYIEGIGVSLSSDEVNALMAKGFGPKQPDRELAKRVQEAVKVAEKDGNERPKPEHTVALDAEIMGVQHSNYGSFDEAMETLPQRIPTDAAGWYPVGHFYGFPLQARNTGRRGEYEYRMVSPNNEEVIYTLWQRRTAGAIARRLRELDGSADRAERQAARLVIDNESLQGVIDMPFARADELKRKKERLEEVEQDMQNNPSPPPGWLRHGAPLETDVFYDKKKYVVDGHHWEHDGYFLTITDGTKTMRVHYLDIKDSNNDRLFEEHRFIPPDSAPQTGPPQNMSVVITPEERKAIFNELDEFFLTPEERGEDELVEEGEGVVVKVEDPSDGQEVAWNKLRTSPDGNEITFASQDEAEAFIEGINYTLDSPNWQDIRSVTRRIEFIIREMQGQGRLFSRGGGAGRKAAEVREDLRAVFTKANSLLKSGRVKVVQSDSDLPAHLRHEEGGVKGVVDPANGHIYLVADNIGNNVKGVFLHEFGVHAGLKKLLGDKYGDVIRQLRGLKAVKNAAALEAYGQVPDDTAPGFVDEEALAYLVENAAAQDMSILRKVINAVRAWLFRHGIAVKTLTPGDMLAMAAAAARAEATRGTGPRPLLTDGTVQAEAPAFSRVQSIKDRINRAAGREEPLSEYYAENQAIREKDKTFWDKVKQEMKRQFSPGGLLPEKVFELKIWRDSQFNVAEIDIKNMVAHYDDAVMDEYGVRPENLPEDVTRMINDAMTKDEPITDEIKERTRVQLQVMKDYISQYSIEYANILFQEAEAYKAADKEGKAGARIDLMNTIAANLNKYQHRSYRAFDDATWPTKVTDEVLDNARAYLKDRFEEKAQKYDEWAEKAEDRGDDALAGRHRAQAEQLRDPKRVGRLLRMILKDGTAFDTMEQFVKESKLGAKDLSILKKRKDIAPEIRALLGEYVDVRVNFAKTATKQNRLIFNQKFLDQVVSVGLGDFLFTDDDAPVDAIKMIAADSNESYSPLSGYYTTREIEQSFREVLGKEQMADWYRTIVKWNGAVKFGKTVLSPTTAFRNWMSAFFFAMANGHFDMTQMRHSVKSVREYFTHKGEGLAYLRKLQGLGVVYDTPYAGEMMRLLQESKIEDWLTARKGRIGMPVKTALNFAQKFYQFGDDFWKILGFENEVAIQMKAKGISREEAEVIAAERIRNTYPTYSMTGKFVNTLRRFPLAGTFVSFPSEIVRTTYHILRYLKEDMADPQMRPQAVRRVAGLAIASGLAHGLQFAFMAMAGVDEDEEEAFRQLAAPWQKNSNILPLPRDEDGNLQFIDLSFMDPYNYWKRPINAIMRDQPYEDMFRSIAEEVYKPFFGTDIAAGALMEVFTNSKESGGRVFNPQDTVDQQTLAIVGHLGKNLQPGITANMTRVMKAMQGKISPSGRKYTLEDEAAAFFGFRISTHDPRAALYYKSFEFRDLKRDATSIMTAVARDPNKVSDSELKSAFSRAMIVRSRAYTDMARLVSAAKASGVSQIKLRQVLSQSGISKKDVIALMRGEIPAYRPSKRYLKQAVNKARVLFPDRADEIERRREMFRTLPVPR